MARLTAVKRIEKERNNVITGPELPCVTDKSKDIEECNVPIEYIANKMHMSKAVLRQMIIHNMFSFATYRLIGKKTIFYCSSKLLYEQRGIIYDSQQ